MDIQLPGIEGLRVEAASGRAEDEKHSGYCDYRFGDDPQSTDDVGGRIRWLSDKTD